MFNSIIATTGLDLTSGIFCTLTSIFCGFVIAFSYLYRSSHTKSFFITLVILPLAVQAVIMMVNGNIGAGVAIAGAFSLVRFRSAPGSAMNIVAVFLAMAVGISVGMGYVYFAIALALIGSALFIILKSTKLGEENGSLSKTLRITIPEDLEYDGVLDEVFKHYLSSYALERIKTVNLGSMYELKYHVILKKKNSEKALIDSIRVRNGNLPIVMGVYKETEEL